MPLPRFFLLAILALTVSLSSSAARAEWTKTESFESSAKTSLKITEPAGAKAYVTIGGETKEEALPAVFSLPDADAYVVVRIVAGDGDSWTGKVEVKARRQTVVRLGHTPSGAAKAGAGKFIGQMQNWTHTCEKTQRDTLKFVAMKDGKPAFETTLRPNQAQANVELEPGHYSVRVFKGATFLRAKELDIAKDGWLFTWGCT
jgi:hypothetical protein